MEFLTPMLASITFLLVIGWIVRIIVTSRRQQKIAALQAEMQEKLLEKFGSSQEVLEYLQSDAGRQFLDSATFERADPYRRILGSIQAGLCLTLVGIACLSLRGQVSGADEGFVFLGAIGLALGVGFLLSAAATFGLSKVWGLINGESRSER